MTRGKTIAFGIAAAMMGLTIGLYAVEVVFRFALAVPSIPESDAGFRKLVSDGWPRPVTPAKDPGTIRILGLADSFGVAGGDGNYHYRLETLLRERGFPVEVVNFSVPDYSIEHELEQLRRFGARYEPDVVLHAFFVGNDFALGEPESVRYRGIDVERTAGASSWLPHRLTVVRWVPRWMRALAERRCRDGDVGRGLGEGSFSHDTFLEIERVRFGACRRPRTEGPAWLGTTAVLDALGRTIEELPALHMIVVHPDQFQVEPALAAEIVSTFELDPEAYDLALPQKFLHSYTASREVPLIDLTPALRERGREGGLFLPRDTHYNDLGNELAAEVIADAIEPLLVRLLAGG
jgi:hypothetical protein